LVLEHKGLVLWFYLGVNYLLKLNLLVDRYMMAIWKKSCTLLFNEHQHVFLIVLSVAIYSLDGYLHYLWYLDGYSSSLIDICDGVVGDLSCWEPVICCLDVLGVRGCCCCWELAAGCCCLGMRGCGAWTVPIASILKGSQNSRPDFSY
jgi:hypothetical protein